MLPLVFNPISPVPHGYKAGHTSMWLFTFWAGGGALLTLPYCLYRRNRRGDPVALYAWIGGFFLSLGEPMLDTLGHLWWPRNLPGPAFVQYNLHVPLLIPPCYIFFVSMTGYFAYRMFCRGITTKGVFYVWLGVASTDLALEFPGVLTHVYKYYGQEPFYLGNFPLHWAWMNGTGMVMVGLSLYVITPLLRENKLPTATLIFAPAIGWFASYGIVSWPAFAAVNSNLSLPLKDLVDATSLVLCVAVIRCVAAYVTHQPRRPADVASPVASGSREGELATV
jgi:hypothetical protein